MIGAASMMGSANYPSEQQARQQPAALDDRAVMRMSSVMAIVIRLLQERPNEQEPAETRRLSCYLRLLLLQRRSSSSSSSSS